MGNVGRDRRPGKSEVWAASASVVVPAGALRGAIAAEGFHIGEVLVPSGSQFIGGCRGETSTPSSRAI